MHVDSKEYQEICKTGGVTQIALFRLENYGLT